MSTVQPVTPSANKREQEIAHILALLRSKVEDLTQEIDFSEKIHTEGVRTSLTSDIEKAIENPLAPLINLRTSIDTNILKFIQGFCNSVFDIHKEIVKDVYKSNSKNDRLLYFVFLNEDTDENRETLFGALDHYETLDFSTVIPIDFQFIPKEISPDKLINVEKVVF
jgi:hypothetical protein